MDSLCCALRYPDDIGNKDMSYILSISALITVCVGSSGGIKYIDFITS